MDAEAAHQHDIAQADREVRIELGALGDVSDARTGLCRAGPEDVDGSDVRSHESEDKAQERRLSAAVGSD